jgi:DNA-binding CsgD family transcriptional regulator
MEGLYRYGITLEEIGRVFALSRERIRQILASRGVHREEGGYRIQSAQAAQARWNLRKELKDQRCQKFYGCSYETALEINSGRNLSCSRSPAKAYTMQRKSAAERGIGWGFDLPSWWAVWQQSGRWGQRGRGKSGYCMSRIGDDGAYKPGNVQIITISKNSSESYITKPAWMRRKLGGSKDLSARQKQIAALAANGLAPKDIAARVGISVNTVKVHLCNIKQKLGAYAHFYAKAA